MNTLKSKLVLAGALISGSSVAAAHTGGHGMSSWYHFLTSPDHAAGTVFLGLTGLGLIACLARSVTGASKVIERD